MPHDGEGFCIEAYIPHSTLAQPALPVSFLPSPPLYPLVPLLPPSPSHLFPLSADRKAAVKLLGLLSTSGLSFSGVLQPSYCFRFTLAQVRRGVSNL